MLSSMHIVFSFSPIFLMMNLKKWVGFGFHHLEEKNTQRLEFSYLLIVRLLTSIFPGLHLWGLCLLQIFPLLIFLLTWALGGLECGLHPCNIQSSTLPSKQYKNNYLLAGVPSFRALALGEHGRGQDLGAGSTSRLAQEHSKLIGQAGACVAGSLLGSSTDLHNGEKQKTCQLEAKPSQGTIITVLKGTNEP